MKNQYRWFILFAVALAFIFSNAFTLFQDNSKSISIRLLYLLAVAAAIALHFTFLYGVAVVLQRVAPGLTLTKQRIAATLLIAVPLVTVLMMLTDAGQTLLQGQKLSAFEPLAIAASFFQAAAIGMFVVGLSEAVYQYEQLQKTEKEKEDLLRLNILAQYDSLKQQVNPHFLFNSLNSLSSLIGQDPDKAELFVQEMSQVYRYLLQNSRDELSTLQRELNFIHSYLHLLLTRFGTALQVQIDVATEFREFRIPPLTLQLLVENAVKHNEVSSENPLKLTISIDQGRLKVSNNLQKRIITAYSEKIGLANIMARYRILGYPEVEVIDDGESFTVLLPLIKVDALNNAQLQAP
ncbi:sensor histidine kinase [Haliscomenobacter hydrossis]|uniref:Signal transduction histidine kinase n=1 Tax=Haliscomenobacter hydrossis (strain ATCC 27775 / DSM 1100 / LMG 10767 / O) TaxID=760192 RepID=F4KYD8_HALH1|nr:histidine kinase [Haliscomenobacter hydrossis]AEE49379.1 putative signal transduction histidine kinase [Haliscomenobacter hydrossis DSM 1100]